MSKDEIVHCRRGYSLEEELISLEGQFLQVGEEQSENLVRDLLNKRQNLDVIDFLYERDEDILWEMTGLCLEDDCENICDREYETCGDCPAYSECSMEKYAYISNECHYNLMYESELAYLVYSVLIEGDICVFVDKDTYESYPDVLKRYSEDNQDILYRYFSEVKDRQLIINHAQQTMFDELLDEGGGSCFSYGGKFALVKDGIKRKMDIDKIKYIGGGA